MAKKINLGKVGITTEGAYDPSKAYEKLSCVTYNHESWVSTKDVPAGNAPDNASPFWQKMSARGEQGIQGPVGPQGNSAFDGNGVEIVNNLTQGGEAAVLSAEQGKILKNEVTELSTSIESIKPIVINGDVVNAPDEEDITTENSLLKLKDRSALNGMGYVILRKNKTFAEQITKENTIYEIRNDFDLNGASVLIRKGCVFNFVGGSIKNGSLLLHKDTKITAPKVQIFHNVQLLKNFSDAYPIGEVYAEWWGAVADGATDSSAPLQLAIDSAHNIKATLKLSVGVYVVTQTLNIWKGSTIIGADNISRVNGISTSSVLLCSGDLQNVMKTENKATCIALKNLTFRFVTNGAKFGDCTAISCSGLTNSHLSNIYIYGFAKGIDVTLDSSIRQGFSYNTLEDIHISHGEFGITIQKTNSTLYGAWCTLNRFIGCSLSDLTKKAILIDVSWGLNSTTFISCNFSLVGYADAYDPNNINHGLYPIEFVSNYENESGVLSFIGCYFEALYYSQGGQDGKYLVEGYDYDNSAVFKITNVSMNLLSCRFADTRNIVKSCGKDYIYFDNCEDDGYYLDADKSYRTSIILPNSETCVEVKKYSLPQGSSALKDIVNTLDIKSLSASHFNEIAVHYGVENDTTTLYISNNGDGSGLLPSFPTSFDKLTARGESLRFVFVEDIVTDKSVNFNSSNIEIDFNGHTHRPNVTYPFTFNAGNPHRLKIGNGKILSTYANKIYYAYYSILADEEYEVLFKDISIEGLGNETTLLQIDSANLEAIRMGSASYVGVINTSGKAVIPLGDSKKCSAIKDMVNCTGLFVGYLRYEQGANLSQSQLPTALPQSDIGYMAIEKDKGKRMRVWDGSQFLGIPYHAFGYSYGTSRPTEGVAIGQVFFDTSLSRPIWWDGAKWVDATGQVSNL